MRRIVHWHLLLLFYVRIGISPLLFKPFQFVALIAVVSSNPTKVANDIGSLSGASTGGIAIFRITTSTVVVVRIAVVRILVPIEAVSMVATLGISRIVTVFWELIPLKLNWSWVVEFVLLCLLIRRHVLLHNRCCLQIA